MSLRTQAKLVGRIVHSDRGSQYASKAYRTMLKAHGLISMHESFEKLLKLSGLNIFFGSLKQCVASGGITKPDMKHSRMCCNILRYFIITKECIHTWTKKSPNQYETEAEKMLKLIN